MLNIEQIKTKQVGLKLPVNILEGLEEIVEDHKVNRSTIITELLREYIIDYQRKKVNDGLKEALVEVKLMQEGKLPKLDAWEFLDEFENQSK